MTACTHVWVIAQSEGRYSIGICRLCTDERMFENSFDDGDQAAQKRRSAYQIEMKRSERRGKRRGE